MLKTLQSNPRLERSRTKILVAETLEWTKNANYHLARLKQFDYWITDQKPSPEILKQVGNETSIPTRRCYVLNLSHH